MLKVEVADEASPATPAEPLAGLFVLLPKTAGASVFVFLGVASGKWLVAENLQKYSLYRTLVGH
jgi:sorbitol-specific phosphotransferase system component IIC